MNASQNAESRKILFKTEIKKIIKTKTKGIYFFFSIHFFFC